MSLLPDIEITVHELVLDQPSLRKIQGEGRPNVWVEVDPLGLADELDLKQLKSSRARAVHTTISVSLHESVAIEPSEPIWAPLIEALLTEEEQDSDVYFVVRAAESAEHAATPGAEDAKGITDVGTAHLNLEDLLKRAHEPNHEQLPVLAEDGTPVGKLSVSFRCLDAMRFANARKNAADAGGERLGIEVSVQRASLNAKEMVRLEDVLRKRKLKVEVEPAWSATSTALSSRKVPIADGKATFNYQVSVDVAPGTSGLTLLLEALEPAATTTPASKAKAKPDDEEDFSEVNFTLVASGSGSGERDRELGSAGVSLKALLAAGADVVDTQIKLTDESGGTTREIGTLTVSVRALELLTILRSAATGLSDALKPPTLKSLLEAHLARAASKKPPAISATSKRVEFATKADEEAMLQKVGTAATSADAARQMLDELNVRSLPQMVQQLTKNTDEKSDAHAERIRSALDATVETAHKILNSGCGAKRNDFHHDYWPQKRIEKLWHLATLLAARGDVSQRTALVATQQLALQAKLETGAASASLGRYRRRLAEARQPVTVPPLGRRREMAAVQEAFALREVVASYEKLMRGMHHTLEQLAAEHAALSQRLDQSEVLHPGPSPLQASARIGRSIAMYGQAVKLCAVVDAPPLGVVDAADGATADAPLAPASVDKLRAAVAAALGESGGDLLSLSAPSFGVTSSSVRSDRGWSRRLQTSASSGTPRGTSASLQSPLPAASPLSVPPALGTETTTRRRDASAVRGVCEISISARLLRLKGDLAQRVRDENIRLSFRLMPSTLRLPALSTPTQTVRGRAEIELGFDDRITLSADGGAFEQLLAMLSDTSRSAGAAASGPPAPLLHLHLTCTSAAGITRFLGEADVPLAALLHTSATPQPATTLIGSDGRAAADVLVTAKAPELLAALGRAGESARTLALTVHDLEIAPAMLRRVGAWGVWVQTDLFTVAPAEGDGMLCTPAAAFDPRSGHVEYSHSMSVSVLAHSGAERRLLDELSAPPSGTLTLRLDVYCSGPDGPTLLAQGTLDVAVPSGNDGGSSSATDLYLRAVPLIAVETSGGRSGGLFSGGEEVGELRLTFKCADVLRAAVKRLKEEPSMQITTHEMSLSSACQADVSIRSVWLEVHLPPLASPLGASSTLTSQPLYATRGVLHPTLGAEVPLDTAQLTQLGALLHSPGGSPFSPPYNNASQQPLPTRGTVLPRAAARSPSGRANNALVGAAATVDPGGNAAAGEPGIPEASVRSSRFKLPTGVLGRRAKPEAAKPEATKPVEGVAVETEQQPTSELLLPSRRPSPIATNISGELVRRGGALASLQEQSEAGIAFVLRCDSYHGERTLGTGWVDLHQMLLSGEEKLLVGVELKDAFGQQAALLRASVVALRALRLAWWSHARHEHMGLVAHTARLTPHAIQYAAFGGPLSAWVEVQIDGIAAPIGRSAEVMLAGVELPFDHAIELWTPPHSDNARCLEASLRSTAGCPITFKLYGRPAGAFAGEGHDEDRVEIGVATVTLRKLLGAGGDLHHEPLALLDARGGPAGELSVSLLASEVSTRLFGVRGWANEAIELNVHEVSLGDPRAAARLLDRAGARDASGQMSLWIEVDLMGLLPSVTGLTSREVTRRLRDLDAQSSVDDGTSGGGSGAKLGLSAEWKAELEQGSAELDALNVALRSEEEQDSDVYFVLKARGGAAKAATTTTDGKKAAEEGVIELGTAHVNLEEILRLGEEPTKKWLPLASQTTGARVGWLNASVKCIEVRARSTQKASFVAFPPAVPPSHDFSLAPTSLPAPKTGAQMGKARRRRGGPDRSPRQQCAALPKGRPEPRKLDRIAKGRRAHRPTGRPLRDVGGGPCRNGPNRALDHAGRAARRRQDHLRYRSAECGRACRLRSARRAARAHGRGELRAPEWRG